MGIDLVPERLTLVERQAFDFVAQLGYSLVVGFGGVCDVATHLVYAVAEAVVVELLNLGNLLLNFSKDGLYCLEVASRLVAEKFFLVRLQMTLCWVLYMLFIAASARTWL